MTRVTLLHSYYAGAAPSGENIAVELQAEALQRAGHQATIVGVRTDDRARHRTYPIRAAVGVAAGRGINPALRIAETHPDILHVHNLFPNFATHWLADWPGPIVATVHNYRPLCASGTLARDGGNCTDCVGRLFPVPALRHRCYRGSLTATVPLAIAGVGGIDANRLLSRADRLIFLAPRARRIYADAGYRGLDRSDILANFVHPSPSLPLEARERRTMPWLYFGRLGPEKGILRLLDHWPIDAPLHIYGGGPDEAEVARRSTGAITYHGPVDRESLLLILPRHRGLIFPSMFSEGLPTVYLESLAAGLPVVARTGNSAADDIAEHATGVVFSNFEDVPGSLKSLETHYEAHARAAQERYRSGFSPEAWTTGITSIYTAAIASRSRDTRR